MDYLFQKVNDNVNDIEKEFLNALVEEGGYTEEEARAIAIDMGELEDED